jgi:hypothetical protein
LLLAGGLEVAAAVEAEIGTGAAVTGAAATGVAQCD